MKQMQEQPNNNDLERKIAFVIKLGSALHRYGTPAHELEEAMTNLSEKLKLEAEFFYTPTLIMASFETALGSKPVLKRIQPGEVELEKLVLLDALTRKVLEDNFSIEEALTTIDDIISRPNPYGILLTAFCFALVGVSASILLNSGLRLFDSILAFILAFIVGLFILFTLYVKSSDNLNPTEAAVNGLVFWRSEATYRVYESIAAFLASFLATILFHFLPYFSIQIVTIASLIVLMPGLSLTIAMAELATQNLASGTARLMGAAIVLFKLILGLAIGSKIANKCIELLVSYRGEPLVINSGELPLQSDLFTNATIVMNHFSFEWLALFIAPFAFVVLFQAPVKDLPWVFCAGASGFIGAKIGAYLLGPELGAFFGGFMAGVSGNLYARFFNRPAAVLIVPGIILLVPGSLGFRALSFMLDKDATLGLEAIFSVFIIAIALVSGVFFARVVVSPIREVFD